MTDFSVDSLAKEIRVSLRLRGEPEIIEARIGYCLARSADTTCLVAERIWVSREWVNRLFNDLADAHGRSLALPPGAALAARILGL
jgi:hypothetical protein